MRLLNYVFSQVSSQISLLVFGDRSTGALASAGDIPLFAKQTPEAVDAQITSQ